MFNFIANVISTLADDFALWMVNDVSTNPIFDVLCLLVALCEIGYQIGIWTITRQFRNRR